MGIKDIISKSRRVVIVLAHMVLIALAYFLAFYVRFEFKMPKEYTGLILSTLPGLLFIKMTVFYYFDLYSGLWRYVSMEDLWKILKANVISTMIFVLGIVFFRGLWGFPRSIFVLDWGLCVGFVAGIRFFNRGLRERFSPVSGSKTIKSLIIGAGEAGIQVFKDLSKNTDHDIVGFIDDDAAKKGMTICGKKILGDRTEISKFAEKYDIKEIIIAMPSAEGKVIRDIISHCQVPGVKVKTVPGIYKILSGELEIKLRDVQPEDLLGRESVTVDENEIKGYIHDKVVLVTGAGGSIGSELSRQLSRFNPRKLILVDYNENDLYFLERELQSANSSLDLEIITADFKDISILKYAFSRFRPAIVFHAAAFKHVPLMENNPSSAIKNNVIGSRNIIYASEHYGVETFVLISSDKAVNPTNVMGATKRIAEMILQAKSRKSRTKFMAVRFGNVLGSKGSVVPLFKKQIEEERRVTVTHPEAERYFMSVGEAVQLVLQAGAMGKGGEIFVLDMGEQIKIVDFARTLISLSGYKPDEDIPIEFVGLRPGEKLYEETLHDAEKDESTRHKKIFIAQPGDFEIRKLNKLVNELGRLAIIMDNSNIIRKITEIVPSYKPMDNKKAN
ncbi:MAG: nucleoside-diphosphate sugar epimerase/dehydratase [Candidatus Omnitrophota bacterium]